MPSENELIRKTVGRRVTMADVAARAGVSRPTASLVMSGRAKELSLSDALVHRVEQAAMDLDYSPNLLVQNIKSGRTSVLAFFSCFRYLPQAQDQYDMLMMTAIHRAAGRIGYNVLHVCDFPESNDKVYHFLNGGHTDGVILYAPFASDPLLARFRKSRLPAVLLNVADPCDELSSVRDDVDQGMRLLADRMSALGHVRVAAINDGININPNARERIELLCRHGAASGLALPVDRIVEIDYVTTTIAGAIDRLMQSPSAPTVLFCWNDMVAATAIEHCRTIGVRVPEDLSIAGYDGVALPGHSQKELATIKVDLDEHAQRTVAILDDLISGRATAPLVQSIPVRLVNGTTLGIAPQSKDGIP